MTIVPMESQHYGVQITEGHVTTSHRVAVPADVLEELALADVDPARVVEETIDFLLDREPATNIPDEVSIAELEQRYPDFVDELRDRVTTR
jgi:hypothetical protein